MFLTYKMAVSSEPDILFLLPGFDLFPSDVPGPLA